MNDKDIVLSARGIIPPLVVVLKRQLLQACGTVITSPQKAYAKATT